MWTTATAVDRRSLAALNTSAGLRVFGGSGEKVSDSASETEGQGDGGQTGTGGGKRGGSGEAGGEVHETGCGGDGGEHFRADGRGLGAGCDPGRTQTEFVAERRGLRGLRCGGGGFGRMGEAAGAGERGQAGGQRAGGCRNRSFAAAGGGRCRFVRAGAGDGFGDDAVYAHTAVACGLCDYLIDKAAI